MGFTSSEVLLSFHLYLLVQGMNKVLREDHTHTSYLHLQMPIDKVYFNKNIGYLLTREQTKKEAF